MSERHEAALPRPWSVNDAPPDYIAAMLRAIVGIEIPLSSLRGKWKMSQNQPATNREGVAAGLRDQGSEEALAVAAWVTGGPDRPGT
jgi:transcriptional regulator